MTIWKERRVLVTGCNGFVGAHLVKALIDQGAFVVGLIRDIIPDSALDMLGCTRKMTIVYGDVESYDVVERALNDYNIDVCFHLAAQSQVGVANRSPVSTFRTNIFGSINVLEAARRLGTLKAVVVASSDKAYGYHERLPYDEDCALRGTYPYDASKACADTIAQSYYNTYRLPVTIARCGNIFGPCDANLKRIVPDVIRSLSRDEAPLIRSDGKYIRDYIYVADAVDAYLCLGRALLRGAKGVAGQGFNFGTGRPVSVLGLVNALVKISGKKLRPKILNNATGEIRKQYLSSALAKSRLGWRPRYRLEDALKETYDWYARYFSEKA